MVQRDQKLEKILFISSVFCMIIENKWKNYQMHIYVIFKKKNQTFSLIVRVGGNC